MSKKSYFFNVNGSEFYDEEPWGEAWHKAKALAEVEHSTIERTVVCGEKIRYEFYHISKCFLTEDNRTKTNAYIF